MLAAISFSIHPAAVHCNFSPGVFLCWLPLPFPFVHQVSTATFHQEFFCVSCHWDPLLVHYPLPAICPLSIICKQMPMSAANMRTRLLCLWGPMWLICQHTSVNVYYHPKQHTHLSSCSLL